MDQPPGSLPDSPFRAFLALDIGDHVREALASEIDRLRRCMPTGVSWVPACNLHVSIAFLGDVAPETASLVCLAIEEAVAATPPFGATVAGVGNFGSPARPRVLWAGVDGGTALPALYSSIARGVEGCGIRLDPRPFRGHVTLGRVKTWRPPERLLKRVAVLSGESFGAFTVTAVDLMRSTLSPQGATYDLQRRFPLAASGACAPGLSGRR